MTSLVGNNRAAHRRFWRGALCSPLRIGWRAGLRMTAGIGIVWGMFSAATLPLQAQSRQAPLRELQVGLSPQQFQQDFTQRIGNRFAPVCISTHRAPRGRVVIGVLWEKREGGRVVVRAGLSRDEMKEAVNKQANDGFRLTWMTAAGWGGEERYTAVWEKAPGQQLAVRYGYPLQEMSRLQEGFAKKGYVIHSLMAVEDQGKIRFTAVWERDESADRQWQANLTLGVFLRQVRERPQQGYRLRQAVPYVFRRGVRIACIWEKRSGPAQEVRTQLTTPAVRRLNEEMLKKGYRPALVAGVSVNAKDRYLVVWEKTKR